MADKWLGLVLIAVGMLLILAALVRSGQLARAERGSGRRQDSAPRRVGPESDATGDAADRPSSAAARLDELEYRFDALKRAHETLSESIGTRFATMGKRIQRATGAPDLTEAETDPAQSDFLTALSGAGAPRSSAAPHNGARRLVPRGAPRR